MFREGRRNLSENRHEHVVLTQAGPVQYATFDYDTPDPRVSNPGIDQESTRPSGDGSSHSVLYGSEITPKARSVLVQAVLNEE